MGQQTNRIEKKRRRERQIKRKKARVKEMKKAGKAAS